MNITRHISIDDEYVRKIKPYVEKHNGNFGAAIRELVYQAERYSPRANSSAMELSMFNWMLKETEGTLVPDNVLDEFIDPALINSIGELEEYLNRRFGELDWGINLSLKYNSDTFPSEMLVEIRGSPQKIKFAAGMLSQYLVKNSLDRVPLGVRSVTNLNECIKVQLSGSNRKEAQKSLLSFFGRMDRVVKIIKSSPVFWKTVIDEYLSSDYNMVTVHRNYFEDLLANKVPSGEIAIEALAKKPLREIPLRELLPLVKKVYETSGIAGRVEIDKEKIMLFHNYRNKEAVEKLKKIILSLLEASGNFYDVRSTANMIVLTHMPDVGIKINEIVDSLKTSDSSVDQELVMFMAFLAGLKEIPDIPLSMMALGRKIGTSLMQEYEKENKIGSWTLEDFQKALELIDSRLHRESEWKLEGGNLLYTIKKCNIAAGGDTPDTYICRTAREAFKGALSYVFSNRAELEVKKLLTHGDNFCEVVIRIL